MRSGPQPVLVGLPEKPVARHRRNHDVEGVRCARAMCRGIGQRIDDLQLLDDRAGPSVRDDERQRIFMFRTNVNEMNVQPIDLGDELRQGVQLRLALAPVVICRPIAREFLHRRERHALRLIRDRLPVGPPGRRDAPAEIDECLFRNVDAEGADCVVSFRRPRPRGCGGARGCRDSKAEGAGGCRSGEDGAPVGFGHVIHGEAPEFGCFWVVRIRSR